MYSSTFLDSLFPESPDPIISTFFPLDNFELQNFLHYLLTYKFDYLNNLP